ncbi:MAG: TIGR03084 family metal-binding protein [Acidimicrobiales bacterium]
MSADMDPICNDLAAEHTALDAIVADLTEQQWATPTPASGWDVRDTIVHIVQADEAGYLAVADPERFEQAKGEVMKGGLDAFGSGRGRSGAETLAWWRDTRQKMLDAFRPLGAKDRIPWFGPSMSALSFATARLMETWSHGQDVATALGRPIAPTDRLRHVAHIGVTTRGWSYANRGRQAPDVPVRVELLAPSGDTWRWGPDDAVEVVRGDALDFCLVVTQRVPVGATKLQTEGGAAAEWMALAQAFAGPPTITEATRAG